MSGEHVASFAWTGKFVVVFPFFTLRRHYTGIHNTDTGEQWLVGYSTGLGPTRSRDNTGVCRPRLTNRLHALGAEWG